MSYQPGEPSYTQPQDPWSGSHGSAAAPTDPIPAPPPRAFAQGVATPAPPRAGWSQETISHHDPYEPGGRARSRTGIYVFTTILALLLAGAGGYGAWLVGNDRFAQASPQPSDSTSSGTQSSTPADTLLDSCPDQHGFDACKIAVQDCLINAGTADRPVMQRSDCGAASSFKVLKIARATEIGDAGLESEDAAYLSGISNKVCAGTGATNYFAFNYTGVGGDRFFCITSNH